MCNSQEQGSHRAGPQATPTQSQQAGFGVAARNTHLRRVCDGADDLPRERVSGTVSPGMVSVSVADRISLQTLQADSPTGAPAQAGSGERQSLALRQAILGVVDRQGSGSGARTFPLGILLAGNRGTLAAGGNLLLPFAKSSRPYDLGLPSNKCSSTGKGSPLAWPNHRVGASRKKSCSWRLRRYSPKQVNAYEAYPPDRLTLVGVAPDTVPVYW